MTDKELLEAAARAAGIKIDKSTTNGGGRGNTGFDMLGNAVLDWHNNTRWNPLTDDGDALRLAVKLKIRVHHDGSCAITELPDGRKYCWLIAASVESNDHCEATRRAIVRAAAAEIGKNK